MGKCASVSQEKKDTVISCYSCPNIDDLDELKHLVQIPNYPMSQASRNLIVNALGKNHLFRDLHDNDIENLLKSVKFCVAEKNSVIFSQGSKGTLFYIINSGQVKVFVNNQLRGILKQEDCFGEMALLTDTKRKATLKTMCKCSFWVISSFLFFKTLKSQLKKNHDQIRRIVKKSIFFNNLSDSQIDLISKISILSIFEDHQEIIREGDNDDLIFILKSGIVSVKKGSKEFLRIKEPGEIFGEGALISGSTRSASCISIGRTEAISINFSEISQIFKNNNNEILLANIAKNSVLSDEHLGFIDKGKIIDICLELKWFKYKENEKVFTKTEKKINCLYVICAGGVHHETKSDKRIGQYQVIGLGNSNQQSLVVGNYVAENDTIIGKMPVKQIDTILNIKTSEIFQKLDKIKFLSSLIFFSSLSYESFVLISKDMVLYTVLKGTKVFEFSQLSSNIYLVKSGVIEIYDENSHLLRIVGKDEIFGEKCLYESKRTATAICVKEAEVYAINKNTIYSLKECNDLIDDAKRKEHYQRPITFQTMKLVRDYMVFGKRKKYCIKDKINKIKYDLIIIPKYSLESERDCYKLLKEKDLMMQINHRQIIKLVCSQHDANNVYFITEHIKGSPLKSLVSKSNCSIKQLIMHCVKILEYLHNKNIIHRDFCIDNFTISISGIPYLHNFQSAKMIENRTYTRIGTPYCRSPEMILGRGYTKATDIWSLGVIVYELAYGRLPFQVSYNDNPFDTYQKILNVKHGFDSSVDELTNDFISELLCESEKRLDIEGIYRNRWFAGVNLDHAIKRRLTLCESVFHEEIKDVKFGKMKGNIQKVLKVWNS